MGSYVKKKIEYLVVDTSAFINKAEIQELGENILTVPQVVEEIKSKHQLRRLVVLPYELSVKEALSQNIKFVTEFSKKTGDYASLSVTDINIIALTYQLEKEKNGADHLRSSPLCRPTVQPTTAIPEDLKKIAGFYVPKKGSHPQTQSEQSDSHSQYYSAEDEEYDSVESEECDALINKNKTVTDGIQFEKKCENDNEKNMLKGIHEKDNVLKEINYRNENESKKNNRNKNISEERNENENVAKKNNSEDDSRDDLNKKWNEEGSDEDDDDSHWITPSNIDKAKNQIASELQEEFENVYVACLTTDFAMQNVLKQIGLHVISVDGKLIKQLRTFILRCYGCFKTTSIMTKVFCPNCGNKTLKKVAVSLDENGVQKVHINFCKPLTARGKRYSLPVFKGGKHSNNPVVSEDQPMPQQRPSRLSRTKNNPLNDDYIAGYSPFVTRDVTSKSAMLGIKPHIEMKHWMRKNPNESRKKKK